MTITEIIQKAKNYVEDLANEYNDDKKYPNLEEEIEYNVLADIKEINDNQYAIFKFWLYGNLSKLYEYFDDIVNTNYRDAIEWEETKKIISYY